MVGAGKERHSWELIPREGGGWGGLESRAHYAKQKTESELAIKMPIRVLMNANVAPF